MQRSVRTIGVALTLLLVAAACSSGGARARTAPSSSRTGSTSSRPTASSNTTAATPAEPVCGAATSPPPTYRHVVIVMEENRTWPEVGGVGFTTMPYLHELATKCASYAQWQETNPRQNSLTQYIGLTSGVDNPATVDDCAPSAACSSTDDNIFRQVRAAGGTARTYVEGATTGCSAGGGAAKHVPALYYFGADDHSFCPTEVRPLDELDVDRLPTFVMVIPDLCHDGHDCENDAVDAWLRSHLGAILGGASYRSGTTAVFVLYDEDRPVPNLLIAPTARNGPLAVPGAGHNAALRTIEDMLGLPALPAVGAAANLRSSAHI